MRLLRADEIECRISTVKANGVSLLLYKDARVDQKILDEECGPFGWQRTHEMIGDRLYCTISIWDKEKQQWISKQDVGTESYTEKEKGQASDSFKRAGFNWGIGRELYTAPFIWVKSGDCEIKQIGGKNTCYDRFEVAEIGYDSDRNINRLVIRNEKTGRTVYTFGKRGKAEPKEPTERRVEPKEPQDESEKSEEQMMRRGNEKVNEIDVKAIRRRIEDAAMQGKILEEKDLCQMFGIDRIEDMTVSGLLKFNALMEKAGV